MKTEPASAYASNVTKLLVFTALTSFQLWISIWVIYLRDARGLSFGQITTLEALLALTVVFMELPTGVFADRFGRKLSLICGSLIFALAMFIFGVGQTFPVLLIAYILVAVSMAFQSGADSALLYDSLRNSGRESDFTKLQGHVWAVSLTAALLGGLAGAPLAAATDLATPILLSVALSVPGIFVAFTLREVPHSGVEHTFKYLETAKQGLAIARRNTAIRFAIAFGALAGATDFVNVLGQPFLVDHGASLGSLGLFDGMLRVGAIAGSLLAYRVAQVLGDWRFFAVTPLLLAATFAAIAGLDSIYAFTLFPIISLMTAVRAPLLLTYINDRIPSGQRATVLSINNLIFSVCVAVVLLGSGLIVDQASYRLLFIVLAVFSVSAVGIVTLLWHRSGETRRSAASL